MYRVRFSAEISCGVSHSFQSSRKVSIPVYTLATMLVDKCGMTYSAAEIKVNLKVKTAGN